MTESPGTASQRVVWSVAALAHAVSDALAARFSVCVVRGEVSGFSRAASGHCYFNLKDADGGTALVRCAMFRRAASLLNFTPGDGQLVELRGRLGVYEPRGELQLVVESMQRSGAGALYDQFLRLKNRLEAEGLFDSARKRALPAYPRCIGVVTSLGAAALRDVATALARRAPHVRLIVYPTVVQGAEAPEALCAAIATAVRRAEAETLIVCRGGGSMEDLWAFNDERVVRAVASAAMPVVCGVGHETDVTLCDFAADVRAATPTAAAELAAPERDVCVGALEAVQAQMQRRALAIIDTQAQRLDRIALRLARPAQSLRRRSQDLDLLAHQLGAAARRGVELRQLAWTQLAARWRRGVSGSAALPAQRVENLAKRLDALDPHRVLARGYAWLRDSHGRHVQSVQQVSMGDTLQAVLADGQAAVVVTDVQPSRLQNGGSGRTPRLPKGATQLPTIHPID